MRIRWPGAHRAPARPTVSRQKARIREPESSWLWRARSCAADSTETQRRRSDESPHRVRDSICPMPRPIHRHEPATQINALHDADNRGAIVLDREAVRAVDRAAIEEFGV